MKKKFFSFGFLSFFCFYYVASANEDPRVGSIREFYRSIRAMGMGNAFIGSVNDCEALYYNPAALARLRRVTSADILNPQITINRQIYDLATNFSTVMSSDSDGIIDYMETQIGKTQYASASLTPNVCYRNFGFGLFEIAEFDGKISNRSNPTLDVYFRNDYGFILGGAYKIFGGRLKFGMSAKYIVRVEGDQNIMSTDFLSGNFDLEKTRSGTALAIDGSILWTIPYPWLPRFSMVVENIGNTYFKESSPVVSIGDLEGPPNFIRQRVHLSLGLSPRITSLTKLNMNFEVRDIFRNTEDYYRLLHIGAELEMPYVFKLRFGFNQGYLTYGATLDFNHSKFEFASYSEELGAYAGQKYDTKYMGKYTFGF